MGFSGLLQIIAMGAFVVGVIGVALVVTAVSQNRPIRGGLLIAIVGIIAGLVFMLVGSGLLEVGPTEVAVVFNQISGKLEEPRLSGISVILPGIQQVTKYSIGQQEYTMSGDPSEGARVGNDAVEARSVDGQSVVMDITVLFKIDPSKVNQIHVDWSTSPGGYGESLIRPQTRSVIRDVVSGFQAAEIYGTGRDRMQTSITDELRSRIEARGFTLNDVLVRNITFSDEFAKAIEDKQIAQQNLEKAKTEAEQNRTVARGKADAVIETARGDAESTLVRSRANAEALRLVSEQIAANPNLIQYVYIQTLADNIKLAIIPSNTPFLFNSDTFTQLAPDFVPPPALPDATATPEGGSSGG
jgi:regulator of protease activity HflC (stomatin/prohibitin superfamily)